MDRLDDYRRQIEEILNKHASIPYANVDLQSETVFDRSNDRYLLLTVGWDGDRRVYYVLVHVEIVNGKVWIQHDGTEDGVATELVAAGIRKEHIVLGFHEPEVRPRMMSSNSPKSKG